MTQQSTYSNHSRLPRLPVPSASSTLDVLRRSVLPIATPEELAAFDHASKTFETETTLAQQQLLMQWKERANWLLKYWLRHGYLLLRDPLPLTTNTFGTIFSSFDTSMRAVGASVYAAAAASAAGALYLRQQIIDETIPPMVVRDVPLCMAQLKNFYGYRFGGSQCDRQGFFDPRGLRHITVMVDGGMFVIEAIGERGEAMSYADLEAAIRHGCSLVEPPPKDCCVGAITAARRADTAKAFSVLQCASGRNRRNLETVIKSIAVICIDPTEVADVNDMIRLCAWGNPHNRWYDRVALNIISANGVRGLHGEHSPMDAIMSSSIPMDLMEKWWAGQRPAAILQKSTLTPVDLEARVRALPFDVPNEVQTVIRGALLLMEQTTRTFEVHVLRVSDIGRREFRAASMPPDAAIQLCIHWAHYRLHGKMVPTYETGATLRFQYGRTDTIRSLTEEMAAAVRMLESGSHVERGEAVAKALAAHRDLTERVTGGHGADRHMLGLKIANEELGRRPISLFELDVVKRASNYVMYTSQMQGDTFIGGFGHTGAAGYGCCYYIRERELQAVISSNNVNGNTSAIAFGATLEKCLRDLFSPREL